MPIFYQTGIYGWDAATAEATMASARSANRNVQYAWRASSQVTLGSLTARWGSLTTIKVNAMALAQNAVVMAYRANDNLSGLAADSAYLNAQWKLGLFSKQTGTLIWSDVLPVEPLLYGLCIDRSGNIVVPLRDGRVLTYGGAVSVATPEPVFRTTNPMASVRTIGTAAFDETQYRSTPSASAATGMTAGGISQGTMTASASGASIDGMVASSLDSRQSVSTDQLLDDPQVPREATWRDVSFRDKPGYSQDEIKPAPVTQRDARDSRWQCDRPCLEVAGVSASSFSGVNRPTNTTDGDMRTRWTAARAGAQSLVYDLGSLKDVPGVTIVWYSRERAATSLSIEVSPDGRTYREVDRGTLRGRGTNSTLRTFAPQSARYVKVALGGSLDAPPPSVYEVGIHGDAVTKEALGR